MFCKFVSRSCTDRHRYCQRNNNGEEEETHFLCEAIWKLLRGISNDTSGDGEHYGTATSFDTYGHDSDLFGSYCRRITEIQLITTVSQPAVTGILLCWGIVHDI